MSNDLYLDQIEKIEYYKKKITERYINKGSIISALQLQQKIDEIDTRLAIFQQNYIAENEVLDVEKFNRQKIDLYADLCVLYKVAYKLAKEKLASIEHRLDCELNELYEITKKYKNRTALESLSIYGNSLYYQTNGFNQKYENGNVYIDIDNINIPSGSYIACMIKSDEFSDQDAVFRFNNGNTNDTKQIANYFYGKKYLKIPGNYKINTQKINSVEDTTTSFDTGISANKKSIYNIFAGENKIKTKNELNIVTYVNKTQNIPLTVYENTEISFYIYNASFIQFDHNSKYSYKSFPDYKIESPKYRQKILINAEVGFTIDILTDGIIYADKQSGFVSEDKVICPIGYDTIDNFMIEEIAYGEDCNYNVTVIVKNADTTFYDIDYISIKQCQISELDGELE